MHLWQAIKMACKSLWTNKLRSFLTMLGIIIGVMTVALLTSVASGVQTAVISSIRTQSTLSIIMNTSENMTYSKIVEVLENEQPDKNAKDYYEYSIISTGNGVVSKDLSGVSAEEFQQDPSGYLHYEILKSYTKEEIDSMKTDEEKLFAGMHNARKKARPIQSSIYAVDENFAEVYSLKMKGTFPDSGDEILVDDAFVKAYLGTEYSAQEAIGEVVSIGSVYYNKLTFKFGEEMTQQELVDLCDLIESKYKTGVDEKENDILTGLGLTIILNDDESRYVYELVSKTLTVNVEFFQNMTNTDMIGYIQMKMASVIPEITSKIVTENPISVEDIYDLSNSKTYTISGVLDEDSSMFTGMSGGMSSESGEGLMNSMMNLMMSNRKGTCYMLLEKSNLAPMGEEETDVSNVVISYAYLRYKTEDVMGDSTTALSIALMQPPYNFGYMTDFMVVSMSSVASIVDNVMSILTTMLTVISIVSLIVGGIGIMNIMLVAVTERTREIGIRKAIGAKKGSILTQFLVEALMLSLIGGAIGLGISAIGCAIIGHFMGVAILMPFWVIAMSLGFCTAIGLIFGMFPAIKASNMQPIDALRRE